MLIVHEKDSEALHIAGEEKSKLANEIDKLKSELSTSNDQVCKLFYIAFSFSMLMTLHIVRSSLVIILTFPFNNYANLFLPFFPDQILT